MVMNGPSYRRSTSTSFEPPAATTTDLPLFDELCDNADEQLFDNVRRNSHRTLHNLLPRNR